MAGICSALEHNLIEQTEQALGVMAGELSAARGVSAESVLVQGAVMEALRLQAEAMDAGLEARDWTPCIPCADASVAIVEQEQELVCDLIIIGKHGQNMAEEWLLGSVTQHVLNESAGDVLVSTSTQA